MQGHKRFSRPRSSPDSESGFADAAVSKVFYTGGLPGRLGFPKPAHEGSTPSVCAMAHSSTGRASVSDTEGWRIVASCANHTGSWPTGWAAVFDTAQEGPTPSEPTTPTCSSVWQSACLGRTRPQVQVLSGRPMMSWPIGEAAGCNPVKGGSTPSDISRMSA
jgi:hypothetical protein